jgi:hypothetical protein
MDMTWGMTSEVERLSRSLLDVLFFVTVNYDVAFIIFFISEN